MLLDSDQVISLIEAACRRAQKMYETSGRQPHDAGRYEGMKQILCIVEGLASKRDDCADDALPLEEVE